MHLLAARQDELDAGPQAEDLGQTPADLVMLSFSDSDLTALAAAWRAGHERLPSLRLANLNRLGHPLSVDLYAENIVAKAKLVVLRLLGGSGYWRYGLDRLSALCRERNIPLAVLPGEAQPDPNLTAYGTVPTDAADCLWRYFTEGGPANMAHLLACAATLAGTPLPHDDPAPVPRFGAYDGWSGPTPAGAPTAAVVFYRSHLLAGDLAPVHALCDALAERGLAPRPLFVASLKEPDCAAWMRASLTARNAAVVVNTTAFSAARDDGSPLEANGSPVLQAILSTTPEAGWQASSRGLGPSDLAMNVVLPEMDGRIIARAIAFKTAGDPDPDLQFAAPVLRPIPDRVAFTADLAASWVRLSRAPRAERRVALVLSDYPGPGGGIGHAVGLDSPASTVAMLHRLSAEGYGLSDIPNSGAELMAALAAAPTPTPTLSLADYQRLAPPELRARIAATWGAPAADPACRDGAFAFRVLPCGNAVVAVQPSRGHGALTTAQHHDPDTPPSHAYLAFHLWLRHAVGIHALVQIGAHGTLEWLPGKAVALSADCWPEIVGGALPTLYPFIVNNPGEGVQARRRLGAVLIGHLTPPPVESGLYGELAALETAIDEYSQATGLDPRRLGMLRETILDLAWKSGVAADCNLRPDDDPDAILSRLDAHLCDIKELQIRDGLHVFGHSPTGERRDRLTAAVARSADPAMVATAVDACGEAEMRALLDGLDGRFVRPGPGGSPARGRAETLPTGRNLYALDPRGVPTPTAWTLGWQAADALITRYLQDHGDWPQRLVVDCWGTPAMRTGGDELAQALALLGVRPIWENGSGRVTGYEIMPAGVLGRPRVDVTLRISGLFRDVFPQQIALFDQAVRAVAGLDEPDDTNPLAATARVEEQRLAASGTAAEDARRWATARIFGAAPGIYGTALSGMIARGDWTARADFGAAYLEGGCHAYGAGLEGVPLPALFRRRVGGADALVHHQDQREHDVLSTDGFMQFEGGFAAAAALEDSEPALYHLDSADPEKLAVRTLAEEIARTLRGRAANPRWIQGMMRHGYRGAAELAAGVDTLFAFAATTDAVRPAHFDQLYDAYVEDAEVWDFLSHANPAAARHILARMSEALDRGLWHPRRNSTAEDLRRLREATV